MKTILSIMIILLTLNCGVELSDTKVKVIPREELVPVVPMPDDSIPADDAFVKYDTAPRKISQPEYICPYGAENNKIESRIFVKVLIDTQGNVRDVKIVKSDGVAECEEAAELIAYQTKWEPASLDGKPVVVWVIFKMVFN